jgi:hypothetical protein
MYQTRTSAVLTMWRIAFRKNLNKLVLYTGDRLIMGPIKAIIRVNRKLYRPSIELYGFTQVINIENKI